MAHYQVTSTSLTPSRPAPAAPIRRGNDIQNVLSSSGYASSFSVGTSSPSGSSYASTYSGIGGSPNRNSDMVSSSHIVRSGMVAIKEDGLVSWLWRPKWLVLKEQTLSIHKNEVSRPSLLSWPSALPRPRPRFLHAEWRAVHMARLPPSMSGCLSPPKPQPVPRRTLVISDLALGSFSRSAGEQKLGGHRTTAGIEDGCH